MIALIERATGLSAADAYSLCSIAADMHVTQIVNLHKGIHVMLAKSALQKPVSRERPSGVMSGCRPQSENLHARERTGGELRVDRGERR